MDAPKIIKALGGPTKVAELMKLTGKHPAQRVHNWIKRGIPPKVQLKHAAILKKGARRAEEECPSRVEG